MHHFARLNPNGTLTLFHDLSICCELLVFDFVIPVARSGHHTFLVIRYRYLVEQALRKEIRWVVIILFLSFTLRLFLVVLSCHIPIPNVANFLFNSHYALVHFARRTHFLWTLWARKLPLVRYHAYDLLFLSS